MDNKKINIDDLPKRNIHKVPDGYFDELPMRIQARVAQKEKTSSLPIPQWAWQLTAAVIVLSVGLYIFYPTTPNYSTEELLAQVSTEDIIMYLEAEDISTAEIDATVDISTLIQDEEDVYLDFIEEDLSKEDLESIYSDLDFSIDVL